jgi:excisionase family DNA binding protein
MSRSTTAPPPRLLTVAHAAERLNTTTSKLYELVAKRSIRSVRFGRAVRILQDHLDLLVNSAGEAPATVRHDEHQRTSRVDPGDELEDRNRREDFLGRRSGTEARRPTSATVAIPERSHSAHDASEPRQPNSCETARSRHRLAPRCDPSTRRRGAPSGGVVMSQREQQTARVNVDDAT